MNKPFKNIDEQTNHLVSKNLIFNDIEKAKQILHTEVNYYKLNGYFHLFLDSNDKFINNISFEDIYNIYLFDTEFRNVLSYYLSIIETSFKNYVSYFLSKKYTEYGYLKLEHFKNHFYHVDFISKAYKLIAQNKYHECVKRYITKEPNKLPLWVLCEILSFSDVSKLFSNMLTPDKKDFCKKYYNINHKFIENWLIALVILRNYCAHNIQLFNKFFTHTMKLLREQRSNYPRNTTLIYLMPIIRMLPTNQYKNDFINELRFLLSKYDTANNLIDFPNNWENILNSEI